MTTRFKFIAKLLCAVLVAISCVLMLTVRAITYHPQLAETAAVTGTSEAPLLKPGQQVKVLSWNVQYLAGKEHVFWYDLPPTDRIPGAATHPTRSDLDRTLREVARIIREEDPDIILLQELDDGSKRTDYENQLALLLGLLPSSYSERTEAFYHRARFVPESHIMGAVGMKLAILSKYRIQGATRHQLPCMPKDLLTRQFYFKRAVLEAHLPVAGARDFVVLNTHFDAFAAGNGTVAKQVAAVRQLLAWLDREQSAWCLGGDFNSLAPGPAYGRLDPSARWEFDETTALTPLFGQYEAVPSRAEIAGSDYTQWQSHWKNGLPMPDRTIDFFFLARSVRLGTHSVRQKDPGKTEYLRISDHFPVIAEMTLP
jgi:endonuclease/exonuclease/phosphatase family metal-dependent hydrolase